MNHRSEETIMHAQPRRAPRGPLLLALLLAAAVTLPACSRKPAPPAFATPDAAVRQLIDTVKKGKLDDLVAIFGAEGRDLVTSSDEATGRRNREVFLVAAAEGWRLVDSGPNAKELVVGNEGWPFPIPLVKDSNGWRFDTAAGKEEVLARRIGRNELAVINVCRTYVNAQRAYARVSHDGRQVGLYARRFTSDAGTQNGLYWPAKRGERRSPLGDLVAQAADEGRQLNLGGQGRVPFHGYFFRILERQGAAAPGGALEYVVDGAMSRGFALIAWPAYYDESGVMTFIVNHDGIVYEKDLGPNTSTAVGAIKHYDPDTTWHVVQNQ